MRRRIHIQLAMLFAALALFAAELAQAQFTVSTNADGTLTIVMYTGPEGGIVIPTNFNGRTVTVVGNGFSILPGSSFETSVSIPDSVVSIGVNAFAGGGYLTNLNVPGGVTNIGSSAFYGCSGLTSIAIPSNITQIGAATFANCSSLSNVLIPAGLTNIGAEAFQASGIVSITIPAGVTTISGSSSYKGGIFYGCQHFTNLTILGSPTIGEYAFTDLPLSTVYIGGGAIGSYGFQFCANMTNLTFGTNAMTFGLAAFQGDPIGSVVVPGGSDIGSGAFAECSLTNVTFSPGPIFIDYQGFLGNAFSSLYIPSNITGIGDQAFFTCGNLTNLVIAAGVTNISAAAFAGCGGLSNVLFLGNAPAVTGLASGDGPVLAGDPATVYYLPGTTGWSNNFGWNGSYSVTGAPTALWNPVAQTTDGSFGVSNGQFGFNVTGNANIPIVVEACTNLAALVWTPLTNVSLTNGSFYFCDSQWTNYPNRFYGIGFP